MKQIKTKKEFARWILANQGCAYVHSGYISCTGKNGSPNCVNIGIPCHFDIRETSSVCKYSCLARAAEFLEESKND